MEKKLVALVFIALLGGLGGGYGLGFMVYQPRILELQSDISSFEDTLLQAQSNVSNVQSEISTLRTDYSELQTRYNELVMIYSNLQSEISILKASENKTWHFVENFIVNNITTKWSSPYQSFMYLGSTPRFSIQGEKWRVKWLLVENLTENFLFDPPITATELSYTNNGWIGLVINGENDSLVDTFTIPFLELVPTTVDVYSSGRISGRSFIWYNGTISGVFYVASGEGEFQIDVHGVSSSWNLTIESYH